jgi:Ca2+-transporting ATPase
VVAAEKAGVRVEEERSRHPRIDAIPFESRLGYMATLHPDDGDPLGRRIILKGGPEVLLSRCDGGGDLARQVEDEIHMMAARGLRVLAVAAKRAIDTSRIDAGALGYGFRFLGLVGMIDPPRAEAIEAVRACQQAGIGVKMITGDHRVTAEAIGRQLGLAPAAAPAISGAELEDLDGAGIRDRARTTTVFARVAPEQKLALVKALQENGEIVAMTGDGVNDAPALKQANIGVAMGITGTDASKQAADIVLTDDNFATIVAAVEEGRRVYDNLVKSLAFVLPTNLGLALILLYAVVFLPYDPSLRMHLLPIPPTQLLWINLVATVALALPLAFEVREPDVMRRPPRDPRAPILSPFVLQRTFLVAVLMTAGAIALFTMEFGRSLRAGMGHGDALREAQTIAVTTVIAFQAFYLLNCRSLRESILRIGLFGNPSIFLGIALLTVLQGLFIYAPFMNRIFGTLPLGVRDLSIAIAAGASIFPIISLEKWIRAVKSARSNRLGGGQ